MHGPTVRGLCALGAVLWWCAGAAAQPTELVPPRLRSAPDPPYPADADGAEARVRLRLEIDVEGRVVDARVVEAPAGDRAAPFVRTALEHVLSLELSPALRDGTPVPSVISYDAVFRPPAAAPDATEPTEEAPPNESPGRPMRDDDAGFGAVAEVPAPPPAPAGELDIDPGALRAVPRRTAEELLTLAPGVTLGNHSGEGHAGTLYLRGFDAGEGQDFEVRVDGVPINDPSNAHGHGYADTHFLIPETVASVRVLPGPFDPAQGDFAVAGSAQYRLGVTDRGLRGRGELGSFGYRRLLLLWAPEALHEGTFAAVDLRDGDGFGPNRAWARASALGRFETEAGPFRFDVLVATHAQRFDSAGVVRRDAIEAGTLPCGAGFDRQFFCLHDPNQSGSGSRHLLSGGVTHREGERELSQRLWLSLRHARFRENFTGALIDRRGDGLDERYEATTGGAAGTARFRIADGRRAPALEVGYLARLDEGRTRAWRVRRDGGAPWGVVFDDDFTITQIGAHAAAAVRPLDALAIRAGVRIDAFGFSVVDRAGPERDRMGERLPESASDALGLSVQPRGTVSIRVAPDLRWATSAGIGTRSSDAPALSEGEQAPFTEVWAAETGLVLAHAAGDWLVDARLAAFYTRVGTDLVFDPERGRNVPAGTSVRYGALAAARLRFGERYDVLGSFTWSEARQPPDGASILDLGAGPRLPFAPRLVGRLDAAVRERPAVGAEELDVTGGLGIGWVGPRPLPLGTFGDAALTIDVAAGVRWRWVELGVTIENLLDARNHAAELHHASHFAGPDDPVSRLAARHVAAAPPRSVIGTLTLHLDEDP